MEIDRKGYRIKLYPTLEEEEIFKQYFGASRFVYNLGISLHETYYRKCKDDDTVEHKTLSFFSMNTKLNELKKTEEYSWLNNFDSTSLKRVLQDVNNAYIMYFKGFCKRPKYKKKKFHHQMFPVRSERLSICDNYVKLPSIGKIYCDYHNISEIIGNGDINKKNFIYKHYANARVEFDGYSYWLSVSLPISHEEGIEVNSCKRFKNNEIWNFKDYSEPIGIDLGCKKNNWIVDSRGNRINRPDTSKEEKRIKKYNRKLATKQRINEEKKINSTVAKELKPIYTKNEEKILKKLNKAYKRISNKTKNAIHEYACSIIEEKPSAIIMEDLDVNGMYISSDSDVNYMARKRINSTIKQSMLYNVKEIITYKAESNKIPIILADREYPSTQLCSRCGYRQKIGITRTYKCKCCGLEIDRDYNAALNLSYLGHPEYNQYDYIIA